MITLAGHAETGRTIAYNLGSVIAVGVGSSEPSPGDTSLGFEVYRTDIRARSYDPNTGIVTFSATIPEDIEMNISEVGVLDSPEVSTSSSGLIAVFDEGVEEWSDGTWVTDNVRVSGSGLRVQAQTAETPSSMLVSLPETLNSDTIQIAYHGAGGTAEVRLKSTDEDYYTISFPVQSGYNVLSQRISDLDITGEPNINSIEGLSVTHSGSGSITMDAMRVHHLPSEEVLILRQKFSTVYHKSEGIPLDIDIPMEVDA